MELYIIRHGWSRADDEGRIEGGGYDAPLTAKGVRQARLLASRLATEPPFDLLFASPLLRAARVAEIVGETLGLEVRRDPRLAEIHTGKLGGMLEEDAAVSHPEPPGGQRSYVPFPGGESRVDLIARLLSFYAELVDKRADDRICIVSHGGTSSVLLQIIYGMPLWSPLRARPLFGFSTGDTGVHRLTVQPGHVLTHYLNDTSHLLGQTGV